MKRKNKIDPTRQKVAHLLDDLGVSRDIFNVIIKSDDISVQNALKYYNDRFTETVKSILRLIKRGV